MKRHKFALSHTNLLSCDMGELVPIGLVEVLPGDTMQQATSALLRCAPLFAPVMHPVHVRIHHWFVPHRLVWEDFEDFITGGPDGMDDSEFPTITLSYTEGSPPTGSNTVGSLSDYLGCVPEIDGLEVSALPFRAYGLIYNEWYRDQDLETPVAVDIGSGADATTNVELLNCAWEKDYFTSARPWEQKGPSITIPLGSEAPVFSEVASTGIISARSPAQSNDIKRLKADGSYVTMSADAGTDEQLLKADLSEASAITVNRLREALALQRFEEARARYGSRYVEYLRYLGVRSSDARLQRPEYLGGGRNTIQFSEVLQTAEGEDPVGEMRGHGIAAVRSNRYRRFFEEHGYVMTLLSVKPKTIYAQGLFRTWNRRVKEDFFQQELQHIGQQEVLNKEVYAAHTTPDGVFGFQDRYDEYRRMESRVSGEFRTTLLDYWHMARIFESDPALNDTFVSCVPTERIFAVPSQDVLYVHARHSIQARRIVAQTGKSYIY